MSQSEKVIESVDRGDAVREFISFASTISHVPSIEFEFVRKQ